MSHFEAFPSELSIKILLHISNRSTLFSLLKASPRYYRIYRTISEEIFTAVTVQELVERGVHFDNNVAFMKIFETVVYYQGRLCIGRSQFHEAEARKNLSFAMTRDALRSLFDQLNSNGPVKLNIQQCLHLLGPRKYITWYRHVGNDLQISYSALLE